MNEKEVMLSVWKFPLEIEDEFSIDMPVGARVLHVGLQGDTPTVWCLVNPKARLMPVPFILMGTGHPILESVAKTYTHVGTFQMAGGLLVFHLFTPDSESHPAIQLLADQSES